MMRIFFIILLSSIFSFSQEYWLKAEWEVERFSNFVELENGDIIALGLSQAYIYPANGSIGQMFLYKVDKYGKTIWKKRYYTNFGVPLYASHMEKGSDGTILVCALTIELDFFSVLKISTEGEIIWSKGYAIEPSRENEYVEECTVKETADGGYMFFILTDFALYLIRISSEGEVL